MVDCPHEGCTNSFYSEKNLRTHLKSAHGIDGAAALSAAAAAAVATSDFRSLDADFTAAAAASDADPSHAEDFESRLCPVCGISLPASLYCAHLSVLNRMER